MIMCYLFTHYYSFALDCLNLLCVEIFQAYYYFAMIQDLLVRFTWTITVTIGEEEVINSEVLKTAVASLEVFRLGTLPVSRNRVYARNRIFPKTKMRHKT